MTVNILEIVKEMPIKDIFYEAEIFKETTHIFSELKKKILRTDSDPEFRI